ncbi:unnamed protein product [Choristocarpus tenellus]
MMPVPFTDEEYVEDCNYMRAINALHIILKGHEEVSAILLGEVEVTGGYDSPSGVETSDDLLTELDRRRSHPEVKEEACMVHRDVSFSNRQRMFDIERSSLSCSKWNRQTKSYPQQLHCWGYSSNLSPIEVVSISSKVKAFAQEVGEGAVSPAMNI